MTRQEQKIHNKRTRFHDKIQDLTTELLFLSLEGNKIKHRELLDTLADYYENLWHSDRQLQAAQKAGTTEKHTTQPYTPPGDLV